MEKKYIKVQFTQEGLHQYKGAPKEVNFLRQVHRHLFYITVKIEVFHLDRELEFLMVAHKIKKFIKENIPFNDEYMLINSCEELAQKILDSLKVDYGLTRDYVVEVSEDNENSAFITYAV